MTTTMVADVPHGLAVTRARPAAGGAAGGAASGRRPVLLVHGWMCDRADMLPVAELLAADHDVVALDLRGHGDSGEPPSGFGLADFAADAAAVIEQLRLGPALVVGHSMGGAVALTLAEQRRELVSAVVLVDAPWAVAPPPAEVRASAAGLYGAEFTARRDRLRAARAAVLPARLGKTASQRVAAESFAALMDWDGPTALRGCQRPVHAIFSDASWPAVAPELHRFPRLLATHVPGTGHWIGVERPDAVAAVVRASGVRASGVRASGADPRIDAAESASLRYAKRRSNMDRIGQEQPMPDDSLVLIHGAQHGAWCWRKMRKPLRAAGFDVHAITLTGLGDRAHLLTAQTDLNTHIADVAALIEMEELTDVTIIGHSYGGMVGAGVIARLPGRIRRMVYFDSPVPVDGETSIIVHPHGHLFTQRRTVIDGIPMLPRSDGLSLGLDGDDLAWARRHLTPQPYACVSTPLRLPDGWQDGVEQVYIRCVQGPADPDRPYLSRVDPAAGWRYHEIRSGHDAMISVPEELTVLITEICAGPNKGSCAGPVKGSYAGRAVTAR